MSDAAVVKDCLTAADPGPAQARRVLAVLARGQVVEDSTPGWVRIEARDVTLHIRREQLDAIQAGQCAIAPSVHCAPPP